MAKIKWEPGINYMWFHKDKILVVWPKGLGVLVELDLSIQNGQLVIRTPYVGDEISASQINNYEVIINYNKKK